MKKAIIGKKVGMTQIFDESGKVIPVTVIEAGPCVVIQKKTTENDGYEAVQLGFGDVKATRLTKPMQGHFTKANVAAKKTLKENPDLRDELETKVREAFDIPIITREQEDFDAVNPVAKPKGKR